MKILACVDLDGAAHWVAFPTTDEEMESALLDIGFTALPKEGGIEYEDGLFPNWGQVTPVWKLIGSAEDGPIAIIDGNAL